MTWFDIVTAEGNYVGEAEGIRNAQGACETLISEGYGPLEVIAQGSRIPIAYASWDEEHQLFLWQSSSAEIRYRLEGREARR